MITRLSTYLLAIALLIATLAPSFALDPPTADPPILISRYELTGENESDMVDSAKIRAVRSAVGRLYFTPLMLRARSLLGIYLDKNAERFVSRLIIHENEIRGGSRFMDIEMTVDVEKLYGEMHTLKFFYRPAFRPIFYAFLAETFDGQNVQAPVGRIRLLENLYDRQYRYLWAEKADDPTIPVPEKKELAVRSDSPTPVVAPDKDLSENLMAACREAQRNEVEVFITGSIKTTSERQEKVYFDDYYFVKTVCDLMLVRSDTGEVLARAHTTTIAGHIDQSKAIASATEAAVDIVTPRILDSFDNQWGKTILSDKRWGKPSLRKSNLLRVMITGTDDNTLDVFRQILTSVDSEAELYTRSYYADIAVLSLCWDGEMKKLLALLKETQHPAFKLTVVGQDSLILELL